MTAFRQQIRFATAADGVKIAFAESGEGLPLVRAAHWMTHLEWDWQTPVWRPWLESLSARHRLYRYDSRGSGLSDRDIASVTLDDRVRGAPPRAREPPRPARRFRTRCAGAPAGRRPARNVGCHGAAGAGRLGPGQCGLPPDGHDAVLPQLEP